LIHGEPDWMLILDCVRIEVIRHSIGIALPIYRLAYFESSGFFTDNFDPNGPK
jgi:hypothetical protein